MKNHELKHIGTEQLSHLVDSSNPVVILLPIGSVEPHGPHLSLETDTIISQACAEHAVQRFAQNQIHALIAPAVPYGVTDCAEGFTGAISIPKQILVDFLSAIIQSFLDQDIAHVCLINNHLEPDQYSAAKNAIAGFDQHQASIACPLERRWARTLSEEFKRGECHAGRYETSIMLAADSKGVFQQQMEILPEVPVSLSDQLKSGVNTFKEMGMARAYAGAPAKASVEEGQQMIERLSQMVVTTVTEALNHS